ncbi:mannosyltransferase [Flagelloscypha sp. PMI_526]|nr:mannosyltransferase [Flagelloscypha sp. PMI_526]
MAATTAVLFALLALPLLGPIFVFIHGRRIRNGSQLQRKQILSSLGLSLNETKIVAFFHPYCNAGGGGERVLWTAIAAIQKSDPNILCAVYTGDTDATKDEIIAKVDSRFSISLKPSHLHFVFLDKRRWVEDAAWPRFTLAGQSFGSIVLVLEALQKLVPDLFIDSMGYAFTYHVVELLARIPVVAYTHYPTISTDMLNRVKERKVWHTNSGSISSSLILSSLKLFYYRLFMYCYSHSLRAASVMMVNSTWTKDHIDSILAQSDILMDFLQLPLTPYLVFNNLLNPRHPKKTSVREGKIVYPPCDTRAMKDFPLEGREKLIVSVAQFRPEKDHPMQVKAFNRFLERYPSYRGKARLVLIGGSRNESDANRVKHLTHLSQELKIDPFVSILPNAPYPTMLNHLSRASIGLNTMVDEHFGINVVEYMAAGAIPVAHKSAGPLKDIVVPFDDKPTGYHAIDEDGFAEAFRAVFEMSEKEDLEMRQRARKVAVQRFGEEQFMDAWEASGWRRFL